MNINIITIGKLKEDYWQKAEKEYLKRLSAFCNLNIIEIKEEKFSEKDNFENIKNKEGEKIISKIPKNSFVILLDKEGKNFSSEQIAGELKNFENKSIGDISFIIGGPLEFSEKILNKYNEKWSFSNLTFTHQMIRIFLLEQIYRGFMIKENRKYHY